MASPSSLWLLAVSLLLSPCLAHVGDYLLTIRIDPADNICLHEELRKGQSIAMEFQVLAGGNLDIDFLIRSPAGVILHSQERASDFLFEQKAAESGPYQFCFSNEFSTVTGKDLFFALEIDRENHPPQPALVGDYGNISVAVNSIHERLTEIRIVQDHLRAREARHRHVAEETNGRVMWWSLGEAALMLLCAGLQVIAVRRFFRNTSKV